jgi:hypothetical protein
MLDRQLGDCGTSQWARRAATKSPGVTRSGRVVGIEQSPHAGGGVLVDGAAGHGAGLGGGE